MPSFYSWMLRLLLLVCLCVLSITLSAIWPDARTSRWFELAGVAAVGLSTLAVGAWTFGAWLSE
jgi:hypothetical protein